MAASRVWKSRLLGFCPINYSVHVEFKLGAVVVTFYAFKFIKNSFTQVSNLFSPYCTMKYNQVFQIF